MKVAPTPKASIARYSPYARKTGRSVSSPISKELSTRFLSISTHTQCLGSTTCSTGLAKTTKTSHHLISAATTGKSKSTSEIAPKTAFTWRDRCYQYTRLAFGRTSAGQISRYITEALATVESRDYISSYIDDNLVHAKTFDKYILALEQPFIALRKFGLYPDKCIFLTSAAKFLGRIVNSKGFKADPEYVRAIREMKPPTSKKELQLEWIRQFLETRLHELIRYDMFSNLMSPMHELNKVNKPFPWTERTDKAFQKIKKRPSSPPVISFPDVFRLFTLTINTSDVACGAILMQEANKGKKNIIAVASRTFNPTEQNWFTTEREAYAIKWAILKFDYFLCNRPFVIFTDHRSLTYQDQREFNNTKIRYMCKM